MDGHTCIVRARLHIDNYDKANNCIHYCKVCINFLALIFVNHIRFITAVVY